MFVVGQITANGEWLGVFCITQAALEPSSHYMCTLFLLRIEGLLENWQH